MGMRKAQIAARFDEIVEFSGVSAFIDTQVKRYSSGMQARLGFSVAAHMDPDVLIVDEVLSVGDMSFQAKCLDRMRQQIANGVTVVFVSHNLQAVANLCSRCIVLGGGQLLFDGPPEEGLSVYMQGQPDLQCPPRHPVTAACSVREPAPQRRRRRRPRCLRTRAASCEWSSNAWKTRRQRRSESSSSVPRSLLLLRRCGRGPGASADIIPQRANLRVRRALSRPPGPRPLSA